MEKRMVIGSGGEKTDLRIKKATIRMKKNMASGLLGTTRQGPLIMSFIKKHL